MSQIRLYLDEDMMAHSLVRALKARNFLLQMWLILCSYIVNFWQQANLTLESLPI
jgi:hypothetical protein